jgi:predicted transcriptional regulator
MENYVTANEATKILGVTRQALHYFKQNNVLKDCIHVHSRCTMYSVTELKALSKIRNKTQKTSNHAK